MTAPYRPDLGALLQLPQPRIGVDNLRRTPAERAAEDRTHAKAAEALTRRRPAPRDTMRAASGPMPSNERNWLASYVDEATSFTSPDRAPNTVTAIRDNTIAPLRAAFEFSGRAGQSLRRGDVLGSMGNAAMAGLMMPFGPGRGVKLPAKWAVLTPMNPGGRALAAAENDALLAQWAKTLEERGISFKPTTGAYTDRTTGQALAERGFLLENVTAAQAEALGREMGQNGVLTHRGYHDLDNQVLYKSKGITGGTADTFTEVGGARFGSDIDWSKPVPRANPDIERMWQSMRQPDAANFPKVDAIDEQAAARMAGVYESLPANDPAAREAYGALTREVDQQFKAIQDAGYTIEFTPNDPYAGENPSAAMMEDLRKNRRLKIFATPENDFHPYLTPEQNNKFRAVHDFLAHAGGGNQFGPLGEENAYRIHAQTLSPQARRALATETRGQNSWVNFGPNRDLPAAQRPFATQKAALWPEEFVGDYSAMPSEIPAPKPAMPGLLSQADEVLGNTAPPPGAPGLLNAAGEAVPDARSFELTRPQNILTPPSSGNVFDESAAGHLRGLPDSYTVNRPKLLYPVRADLSMLDGMPRRVRDVFNPNVERALRETPEARGWYNMRQMLEAMRNEMPDGEEQFNLLMGFHGPTSVGTKVPDNIRQAGYLWQENLAGRLRPALESGEPLVLPEGFANRRQSTVNSGIMRILRDGWLDPITTPKTFRYTKNLAGMGAGIPLDMHVGRQIGLQGFLKDAEGNLVPGRGFPEPSYNTTRRIASSPTNTHYATIEDMLLRHAKRMDISPDEYMALGWVGGARQTGVADTRTPLQIYNQKFRDAAAREGITPVEALQRFLAGTMRLY